MLHPVPLLGLVVLVVNDHWAKATFASALTGKLSDVGGLLYMPALLVALGELALAALRRPWGPSLRAIVAAVVATATVFAAEKTVPAAHTAWIWALGTLRQPWAPAPVVEHLDASDLVALPAVLAPLVTGWRRCRPAH